MLNLADGPKRELVSPLILFAGQVMILSRICQRSDEAVTRNLFLSQVHCHLNSVCRDAGAKTPCANQ